MKMGVALFTVLGFLLMSVSVASAKCKVHPRFWCDNAEIAAECGVVEQCGKFLAPPKAQPVALNLYYESLCPDCKFFIRTQLVPAFSQVASIMNVTLVPYGNTRETKKGDQWMFDCQHGKQECIGNLIETCAINLLKKASIYLPFIGCMEMSDKMPEDAAKECGWQYAVDTKAILNCSTSAQGNQFQHQMAVKTGSLKPPLEYVPWITVDGVHSREFQEFAMNNLKGLMCYQYKGKPIPEECKVPPQA